ncbi:hypothetical protein [Microlunatus parietis]|uniref:Uncharacterized protein n=1 Tax=Microlunatus parietis TaxID=682979 RepID=A0A7Y9IAC1_9ACTN|nr:hypothetical protein [Microlunatus parietis]NYE72906.1 hypothetical protein [Microlunatus parietis]
MRDQLLREAERARAAGRGDWVRHWEELAEAVQDVIVDEGDPAVATRVRQGAVWAEARPGMPGADEDSDLSGCSLSDLETQLRQVDESIRTVSMPDGAGRNRTRNMAMREVAILSVRRRLIAAEIRRRRKALDVWRMTQSLVHSPTTPDA